MQEFNLDVIGTHIRILLDVSSPVGEDFSHIQQRLQEFDARYSRFIPGNWVSKLNDTRRALLDEDASHMLTKSLELAYISDGYFDPTVGKKLAELGYRNPEMDTI